MNETVNILIAGDTHLGGGRVKELALQNATEPLFGHFFKNIQNTDEVWLKTLTEKERIVFEENLVQLDAVIADDELEERFSEFCESSRKQYSSYIESHSNRYLHALRNRNLFPSLLGKRKKKFLLNLTRCETHRDILKKYFQSEDSYTS